MRGKQRRHRTLYISFLISRLWRSLFGRSRLGPWRDRSRRASERAARGARAGAGAAKRGPVTTAGRALDANNTASTLIRIRITAKARRSAPHSIYLVPWIWNAAECVEREKT